MKSLRVNTYNSTPVVDGIYSGTDIANHFKNKYNTLYNGAVFPKRGSSEPLCSAVHRQGREMIL